MESAITEPRRQESFESKSMAKAVLLSFKAIQFFPLRPNNFLFVA